MLLYCFATIRLEFAMRIGAYLPAGMPESFATYADNLMRELIALGCVITPIADPRAPTDDFDVLWDPRAGGGNAPIVELCRRRQPLIVTLHGVAPMALPLFEYFPTWRERAAGWLDNRRKRRAWRYLEGGYAAVVTVSAYSKATIVAALPILPELVFPCHNAVDHRIFRAPSDPGRGGYFLHISNDDPRKNVDRICQAYAGLSAEGRPPLRLKLIDNSRRVTVPGVEVIRERLSPEALVQLYQGAIGFIFPSSYEGFGLPIIEAMACGCPVITSNDNACAEVAADAALTVNPRSVSEIRTAMRNLLDDPVARKRWSQAGIRRAKAFSWEASACCHLEVFRHVARQADQVQ